MKLKSLVALLVLAATGHAGAVDSGYATIQEVKGWDTKTDVIMTVDHACGGSSKMYILSKSDNQKYALVLSAWMTGALVSLSYTCGGDGYPAIVGIRAKAP